MTERMIAGLAAIPGLKLYGISDPARFENRCSTFVVRIEGHTPLDLATKLGERGFFTWDGNYYALNLTEQLDVERLGGFLRIGLVHYNTMEEVERLLAALREIVASKHDATYQGRSSSTRVSTSYQRQLANPMKSPCSTMPGILLKASANAEGSAICLKLQSRIGLPLSVR